MSKLSVVIPFYNHWNLTHQLLFDLYNNCKNVDEVVVVDNGSTENTGLAWWLDNKMLPLHNVHVEQNEGFLRAANRGMQAATGDQLVLISNDVRVHANIVPIIRTTLDLFPLTVMGGIVYEHDTGWNTFDGRTFPYVEGWLVACRRDTWDFIGGFDVRYAPNDFEDVDFSTAAIQHGCKLVPLPVGTVSHAGAQTIGYSPERQSLTETNREKFRQKWITN